MLARSPSAAKATVQMDSAPTMAWEACEIKKSRSYGFDDRNHIVHNTIIDLTSLGRSDEERAAFVRMFLSRLAASARVALVGVVF